MTKTKLKQVKLDFDDIVCTFKKEETKRFNPIMKELRKIGFNASLEIPLYNREPLLMIKKRK